MISTRFISQFLTSTSCPSVFRLIHTSRVTFAEPLKKKKKLDVQVLKMRVERKIRKTEKEIRKLMKQPKQLKPVEEYQLPIPVLKELDARKRAITEEDKKVLEDMEKLTKIWISYKAEERRQEQIQLRKVVKAQEKALAILKLESPELYKAALEIDENFLPFVDDHIIKETPRIDGYNPPDGIKTDVTKVWKM